MALLKPLLHNKKSLVGVTILVTALTYFPVLTLGPLAEGLN